MAETRLAAPNSFRASKGYTSVVWPDGDCDLMAWELNEAQQIRDYLTKLALDRVFVEGIIGELGGEVMPAIVGIARGGQTMVSGGAFIGLETMAYLLRITKGGPVGTAEYDFITSGDDSSTGPKVITAYGVAHSLGNRLATVTWTGSGDFVVGDSWIIPCKYHCRLPAIAIGAAQTPAAAVDTLDCLAAYVYLDGKMLVVPPAVLEYEPASSGKSYVYLEALVETVTFDQDPDLLNPRTHEGVAWRERYSLSFKASDPTGEDLPERCSRRIVRPVYEWDRATNDIKRTNETYSRLDLSQMRGLLPFSKLQGVDMSDELMGTLAMRTDEESGSYIVGDKALSSFVQEDENEWTVDEPVVVSAAGDDTPTAGGTYKGSEPEVYLIEVVVGGAPGIARIKSTGIYDSPNGITVTVEAFGAEVAVGTCGAAIVFPGGGDGILTAGASWRMRCATPSKSAVKTRAGVAYVNGLRYDKKKTELKLVDTSADYAEIEDEPATVAFGTNVYRPAKTAGDDLFPVRAIGAVTAEVTVRKLVSHPIGDGADELPLTPVARILAVTDSAAGSCAKVTSDNIGPFNFSGTGASARKNRLDVQASAYAGGDYGETQTIFLTPGSWTIDQILEALNQGTGPAYQAGRANENIYWSSDGGKLVGETMAGGSTQKIKVLACGAQEIFGFDVNQADTGAGSGYQEHTSWEKDGNYVDWSPAGPEPSGSYFVIFSYSKALVAGTDRLEAGALKGVNAWCVVAYRSSAVKSWPSDVVSLRCSPEGDIVDLAWAEVPDAIEYHVYRGSSTSLAAMKLIAILPAREGYDPAGAPITSYIDTGRYAGGATLVSAGSRFMSAVTAEALVRGAVNLDVPYAFDVDGDEFESNRPSHGENMSIDYSYWQPKYVLRCLGFAVDLATLKIVGVIEDIIWKAEDHPVEPRPTEFRLPVARILCPAGGHVQGIPTGLYNYKYRRYTMVEIGSLASKVEDLNRSVAELDMVSQARDGESAALRGVFADAFAMAGQGDTGHPDYDCAINPVERCMQLPFEVTTVALVPRTVRNIAGFEETALVGVKHPGVHKSVVTLDYNEVPEISQPLWSREYPVNPYLKVNETAKPTAWIILSPARDYWVDTQTITYDELFLENWYIDPDTGQTTQVTDQEIKDALARGVVPIAQWEEQRTQLKMLKDQSAVFARPIAIEVYGHNFYPNASVKVMFSDVAIQTVPRAGWSNDPANPLWIRADGTGAFRCTVTVPAGTRVGQHEIRAIGYRNPDQPLSGKVENDTTASFVSEGKVQVLEERKIKAHYFVDPVCQTFVFLSDGFLTKLDVPVARKDAALPLQFLLRDVRDGSPTEDCDCVAVRAPGDIDVATAEKTRKNEWVMPDPVFMDSRYQKAATFITQSIDGYYLYAAEAGKEDLSATPPGSKTCPPQAYDGGVLQDSADFQAWTPQPYIDMRFTAYRADFDPDGVIATAGEVTGEILFEEQAWTGHAEITGVMIIAGQAVPSGTSVDWQYRVMPTSGDPWSDWRPIKLNSFVDLVGETAFKVQTKAILRSTNARLSPTIAKGSWAMVLVQRKLEGEYLNKTTDLVAAAGTVKVSLEELNPAGTGAASDAVATGWKTGPYAFSTGSEDQLYISVNGGAGIPVTLEESDTTAEAVQDRINGTPGLSGVAAVIDGRVVLTADHSIELMDVAHDAYDVLGMYQGAYHFQAGGHEVMLSPDGGHTWLSPSDAPEDGGGAGQGYTKREYVFDYADTTVKVPSVKVRVRQVSSARRYATPKARKLVLTIV